VDGVRDDCLKADRYLPRVDLEIRKWREICVLLNREQVARIINCLNLCGDKEGVGIESHRVVRSTRAPVMVYHPPTRPHDRPESRVAV